MPTRRVRFRELNYGEILKIYMLPDYPPEHFVVIGRYKKKDSRSGSGYVTTHNLNDPDATYPYLVHRDEPFEITGRMPIEEMLTHSHDRVRKGGALWQKQNLTRAK